MIDSYFQRTLAAVKDTSDLSGNAGDFEQHLRTVFTSLFDMLDNSPEIMKVILREGLLDSAMTKRMLGILDLIESTEPIVSSNWGCNSCDKCARTVAASSSVNTLDAYTMFRRRCRACAIHTSTVCNTKVTTTHNNKQQTTNNKQQTTNNNDDEREGKTRQKL